MISIRGLILLFAVISLANAWAWSGLDICNDHVCHGCIDRPSDLDINPGFNAVDMVCINLVGHDGSFSYQANERRHVCVQAANGDNAYRFDYDVHRNKCPDENMTLDFHTCHDVMIENLNNTISCGSDPIGQKLNCGQRAQVGCFDVSAAPQPGLCAGTLPYNV